MGANNKIGLGTVQFGMDYGVSNTKGKTPDIEVSKILEYAKKEGLLYIDTAEAYGCSEEVLGRNDLSGFRIISKFLPRMSTSKLKFQNFPPIIEKLAITPCPVVSIIDWAYCPLKTN